MICKSLAFLLLFANPVLADNDGVEAPQFFGSCDIQGVYGQGCIEFYDGAWTNRQMKEICVSLERRGATAEIKNERCDRDMFQELCISQQLFSEAFIYINHIDMLSCHGIMNGKLYHRPEDGW